MVKVNLLNDENVRIILYGAGSGGQNCFKYLQNIGLSERVVCFVDSNSQKQGKMFCGKEIRSLQYILENPNMTVIISAMYYTSVLNILKSVNIINPVYGFFSFMPPWSEPISKYKKQDVVKLYDDSESITNDIIDFAYFARQSDIKIQPIENILPFAGSDNYWCDESMPSLSYNKLTICDGGAFKGETLEMLHNHYGEKIKKYIAFEPSLVNYQELKYLVSKTKFNKGDKSILFCAALGNTNETIYFEDTACSDAHVITTPSQNSIEISCVRFDDLNIQPEGKLCIKMDIEGYELKALQGMAKTIEMYKPELAICVYHRADDLYEIPHFIKSINPDYRCVIRGGMHMICFAHCEE
jgi:FkbM family methyltransferase